MMMSLPRINAVLPFQKSAHITTETMKTDSILMFVGLAALVLIAIYLINPGMLGMGREGYADVPMNPNGMGADKPTPGAMPATQNQIEGAIQAIQNLVPGSSGPVEKKAAASASEGFESGPADFGDASAPAGCYPRDQLSASELLPRDANSVWAQQNPLGPGSLKGVNFLSAGALIGINTVGQSMKNANLQLRSEPPNPQVPVSVFNNSTIEPDFNRRPLEIN